MDSSQALLSGGSTSVAAGKKQASGSGEGQSSAQLQ